MERWSGQVRSRERERERYIGQQVQLIGGCGPTTSYLLVMAFRFIVGGRKEEVQEWYLVYERFMYLRTSYLLGLYVCDRAVRRIAGQAKRCLLVQGWRASLLFVFFFLCFYWMRCTWERNQPGQAQARLTRDALQAPRPWSALLFFNLPPLPTLRGSHGHG